LELRPGVLTVFDLDDWETAAAYVWYAAPNAMGGYYVVTHPTGVDGRQTTVYLHRVLTGAPKGKVVDHWNHDTLDNRRENLRVGGQVQNMRNRRGPNRNSGTGVRGVSVHRVGAQRYYCARFHLPKGQGYRVRYFPLTEEGLRAAAAAVEAMRAEASA
jgi:hypothetical protein